MGGALRGDGKGTEEEKEGIGIRLREVPSDFSAVVAPMVGSENDRAVM